MFCALDVCVLLWDTPDFLSCPHVNAQATFKEPSVYSLGLALQRVRSCQQSWAKVVMAKVVGQDLITIGTAGAIDILQGTIRTKITTQVVVSEVWQGTFRICWEKLLRSVR